MSRTVDACFRIFAELADDADALKNVRGLILDLGVQGKLTARVLTDQKDLVWQRLLESSVPDEGIAVSAPFELPAEWVWAKVGSVANNCGQKTPNKCFTYIDVGAIDNKTGTISDEAAIMEAREAPSRARKLVKIGTVIYSTVRPYLKNIAIIDRVLTPEPIVSTAFAVMLPKAFLDTRFLFYWLRSSSFEQEVAARMKGVAYPAINDKEFRECPIPLPPLAEQKRIVAKVDALMAQCDRLEAQLRERDTRQADLARAALARFAEAPTPANLNLLFHDSFTLTPADLRNTILTLAVRGKLVPQDSEDEAQLKAKEPEVAPFCIPRSWKWRRLGQESELINGDRSKNYPNKAEYVQQGVAWINTGHIEPNGDLCLDSMHYITRAKFESLRSGKIRSGDLVYCLRGATLGKTAIITQFDEGAIASSLVIIRLSDRIDARFAYRVLTSPFGREQIFKFDNGSAQPNLSANSVKKYWFPIPPLTEQRRIVAKVDQLMAMVDQWEVQLNATRATAAQLLDALVAELTAATPKPAAETIDYQRSPEYIRATLAAEIVDRMNGHQTFGRVKLQKVLYLAEYIAELPEIQSQPKRRAMGPHDPEMLAKTERKLAECEWFAVQPESAQRYVYQPLARAGAHRAVFDELWPEKGATVRALTKLMLTWKTERCERFATAYAAWNDLILRGEPVSDEAILTEVLERWHPGKQKIARHKWLETLDWMRAHGYAPTGFGRETQSTSTEQGEFALAELAP